MLARIRHFVLLGGFVCLVGGVALLQAQIHGVPASVTSFGFGGNTSSTPGVAASVTSLGPLGFGNSPAIFGNCCFNTVFPAGVQSPIFVPRHRARHHAFFPAAVPVFTVPYTQVVLVQPESVAYDDEEYNGGPAMLDRSSSYRSRLHARELEPEPAPAPRAQTAEPAPPDVVVSQPTTVLVFKDGHQAEVQNYAIVGDTLFDFADGRSHKILLADLDLPATRKANDTRGVDFQVPADPAR
jgi:hypothetical protein